MARTNPQKILIAPLDWGLGHATRCIPVIKEFLNQGCEVQIASSGDAFVLLKNEFPHLKTHRLASYQAEYSRLFPFVIKIAMQLPKFLRAINQEHKETATIIEQEKIDIVISDNRYGCWSREVPSIFICHQLNLKAPIFATIANYFHQRAIRNFSEVWIPDEHGEKSLAGTLASTEMKENYIGLLSRMTWSPRPSRREIMVILSGPEPQRTIFEEIVLSGLRQVQKRCLVVRGLPAQTTKDVVNEIEIVSHLSAEEMNNAILESEIIVSRSGYSTIMDLAVLGKKAIFVPTPGQPEQEYLATSLAKKKIAFTMRQDEFNLREALNGAEEYRGFERAGENSLLKKAIEQILK